MIPRRTSVLSALVAVLAVLTVLGTSTIPTARAAPPDDVIQDLGAPLTTLTVMDSVFGREDGRDVVYAVPAGENARLNIVDVHTRELIRTVALPGAAGTWAITIATDLNVYIGSYSNAHLYRYSPATKAVTDLGQPIPGEGVVYGLTAGLNGVVYGGTYPNAHAFKYDPATGVTDYGQLDPVQQYVRAAVFDPDHNALFAGLATPAPKLIRIDLATGAKEDITPEGLSGKGFDDLDYAAGRVFGNMTGKLVVFDAATNKQIHYTDTATGNVVTEYPIGARGVSPAGPGGIYFTSALTLTRYDPTNDTVGPVPSGVKITRGAAIGYGWVDDGGTPMLYGLGGNYSGGTWRYNPATGTLEQWSSPFQYVPVNLMHTIADPMDGKVYLNAFLNGSTGAFDPVTGKLTLTARQGQVEGWNWGPNGKLFVGIYPYGRLSIWDPHAPESPTNPQVLFDLELSHLQNRPVSVVPTANKVYLGTTPGYGEYGGALTVYDLASKALAVHRNIVVDQTIASVLPLGAKVWAGSSIESGQGTEPRATEAHLVSVDPNNGTVLTDVVPVPGADSVNELSIGPDGNLWGLADGTVFVANPATGEVLRRIPVFNAGTGAADGALSWRDGYLYGVSAGRLFVVDSLGTQGTVLRDHGLNRLTQTPNGVYYTLLRPDGYTNSTNVASYTPPPDPCLRSDLRATVWTGNIDSHVVNRHVRFGCTLIDELPDAEKKWPSHGAYVSAVNTKVRQLESAGLITRTESFAISFAAASSNVGS